MLLSRLKMSIAAHLLLWQIIMRVVTCLLAFLSNICLENKSLLNDGGQWAYIARKLNIYWVLKLAMSADCFLWGGAKRIFNPTKISFQKRIWHLVRFWEVCWCCIVVYLQLLNRETHAALTCKKSIGDDLLQFFIFFIIFFFCFLIF